MFIQTLYERNEVMMNYNRMLKVRRDGTVELRIYDNEIMKIKDGYINSNDFEEMCQEWQMSKEQLHDKHNIKLIEDKKKFEKIKEDIEYKSIRSDSLSRTRNLIIDYSSENNHLFKSFITLTFSDNITDLNYANKCFHNWCKQVKRLMKKQDKDFYYLGVPEFQKRGAVHYHLYTNLECDVEIPKLEPIKTYNKEKKKWYDLEYYNIMYWKQGFSSAQDLKVTDENFNIALYMCKYLYKDIDNRLYGRCKILKSNNLKKPNVYKLSSESIVYQTAWLYINDLIKENKNEIENIYRIESTNDKPFIKNQTILTYKLHDEDNILKDILKNDLEF